jgi:putative hydrolase of the HAD superfamily
MKNGEIKVIFFDVGGVLLSDGWGHLSRQKAAREFDFDYDEAEARHQYLSHIFELGKITLEEYLDRVIFFKPRVFSQKDFKAFMLAQSIELPDMLQWLKSWKKESGYTIISLNNESRKINDYRINHFGLHECFDAFVSSCTVGLRKPDPELFRLAPALAHFAPANCLFFDDRLFHVESARRAGMIAYQHNGFDSTKAILEQIKAQHNE